MTTDERVDGSMLRFALPLFSFSMLCFAAKAIRIDIWPFDVIPGSANLWLLRVIGGVGLLGAVAFLIATFWRNVRQKFELRAVVSDSPAQGEKGWIPTARLYKWLVMWLVFFGGWLGGLSNVAASRPLLYVTYVSGWILCLAIFVMIFRTASSLEKVEMNIKSARQLGLWLAISVVLSLWLSFEYPANGSEYNWGAFLKLIVIFGGIPSFLFGAWTLRRCLRGAW